MRFRPTRARAARACPRLQTGARARWLRAALCACSLLLWPRAVHAFADPALFGEAPADGGGGGRWFTGSPRDGYTCAVCHRGGTEPEVELTGLPATFEPGRTYQVTLRWSGDVASHALQLELMTQDGAHPDVVIEPEDVLTELGRCDGDPEGEPANYAVDVDARRVVGVSDCGASRVSFQFVAPDEPRLYFTASVVRTDSSGTAEGDGTLDLRQVLTRAGDSAGQGGCSAVRWRTPAGWPLLALLGAVLLVRLAQRKSRLNRSVVSRASTCVRPTKAR